MEINPAVTFKHDRSIMYAKRPKVLIVGAGVGGLTLGMLLHKANIPFEIYERAAEVRPLGSAMYFNCTTANFFKQCGIYEEFVSLGKQVSSIQMCGEDREVKLTIDFDNHEKEFGANNYIIPHPKLYDLLVRQIPKERIHMGKKVLTLEQGGNGVLIRFSDASEAEGDILVGADGAYSAVRHGLYAKLKKAKKLPTSDGLPLPSSTWSTWTTAQNTICWVALLFLDEKNNQINEDFLNSEWSPELASSMCEEIKDFPIISGGDQILTLEDLMDRTSKEQMSKVILEEKVYKTWYDCRTVLIGDACHKFNPYGGVGGTNAMLDAVVLANRINGLPFHPVAEEIEAAFKAYKDERFYWAQNAYESSRVHRAMVGQSTASKCSRYAVKHIPAWLFKRIQARAFSYRPQVAFLPLVEDNGRVKRAPQASLYVKGPVEIEKGNTSQAL
ncbi:hypothetical protein EC991_009999 [Linnemannia zychae]|nr:hypothetical protein EC991_009999 [Linnemannia zychae]